MTARQVPRFRRWSTPTVRQMMKLVVFAAIASLCLVPVVRWAEMDAVSWPFAILMEAVAIPMVLAIVGFPLLRRGPLKDWLIRALLLMSVGVILAAAIYSMFWGAVGPQALNLWARSTGMTLGFLREVVLVLAFPFILLWLQLVPRLCPACKRWRLLPDGATRVPPGTGSRPGSAPGRGYRCLTCDGRFWKQDGSWTAVEREAAEHTPTTGDPAREAPHEPSRRIRRNLR